MEPEEKFSSVLQTAVYLVSAIVTIAVLASIYAGCSTGSLKSDTTVWRVGQGVYCCERTGYGLEGAPTILECEIGELWIKSGIILNTKIPCDGAVSE